jgi:hypothetical protein
MKTVEQEMADAREHLLPSRGRRHDLRLGARGAHGEA